MDRNGLHGDRVFVCIYIFDGGGLVGLKNDNKQGDFNDGVISAKAATAVTYPGAADGLGRFPNGGAYSFTDKTKITQFRARTINTDLSSVTVDSSAAAGSQKNPYVIATEADWETFVKNITVTAKIPNFGQDKFFVLVNDLDFAKTGAPAFHPAYRFYGTFYGMGHYMKNITVSSWQSYSGSATLQNLSALTYGAYGVFCGVYNATITDLIVDNYSYREMPVTTATVGPMYYSHTGGVAGYSWGTPYFLNCHTSGEVTSTLQYNNWISIGGIVGVHGNATNAGDSFALTLYRCTGNLKNIAFTGCAAVENSPIPATMLGSLFGGTMIAYDCAGNVTDNSNTAQRTFGSLLFGWAFTESARGATAENIVGTVSHTRNTLVGFGGGFLSPSGSVNSPVLKNLFGDMRFGSLVGRAFMGDIGNAIPASASLSNLNIVKSSTDSYLTTFRTNVGDCTGNITAKITTHATRNDLMTKAKSMVGDNASTQPFSPKIWDKSKIGGTYDPENTPVRNYMMVAPQDMEREYDGETWDVTSAPWYMENIHGNADIMTIVYPQGERINANEEGYNVSFNLKSGFAWPDGTTSAKTIKVKVKKKLLKIDFAATNNGPMTAVIKSGLVNRDRNSPPTLINTYYKDGVKIEGVPYEVGTYKVKASLGAGENYKLKNLDTDPDTEIERTFDLQQTPLKTPTASGGGEKTYGDWNIDTDGDGVNDAIQFTLADDTEMNTGRIVELDNDNMPAGATYNRDGSVRTITVKKVKNPPYLIQFNLNDPKNFCWGAGNGQLLLTVKPRDLTLNVTREGGKLWNFETNTFESFLITHDAVGSDNIQLAIKYIKYTTKPDGTEEQTEITVGSDKLTVNPASPKTTKVTLDPLDKGRYKLVVGIAETMVSNDNGNYTLTRVFEQDVNVIGKTVTAPDSVAWKYSDGQSIQDLTDNQVLTYTGREFVASIDTSDLAARGLKVKGYTDATGTNVTTTPHTTVVTLTALNDTYIFTDTTYTIHWGIKKAKFDLSRVKWNYSAPIGYTGDWIMVELQDLPDILTASYTGNRQKNVQTGYTAKVTFSCLNPNYELPAKPTGYGTSGVKGTTYTYKEGETEDFPWELKWTITQGVIATNWNFTGGTRENNGKGEFKYPTLSVGGENVDYKFYQSVSESDTSQGAEIALEDIEVKAGTERTYYVEAVVKLAYQSNYVIQSSNNPIDFTIGINKTNIAITLTKQGGVYDGTAKPIDFTAAEDGKPSHTFPKSNFSVTYFDANGSELTEAPTNAGNYKVQIELIDATLRKNNYVHNGTFAFTIAQCPIDISSIDWDYTGAFTFTQKESAAGTNGGSKYSAVVHKVALTGVPRVLTVAYVGNESSAVGVHEAVATINVKSLLDSGNYKLENLIEGTQEKYTYVRKDGKDENDQDVIESALLTFKKSWEVKVRKLTIPKLTVQPITFDNQAHDVVTLLEFDVNKDSEAYWDKYMTVIVKLGTSTLEGTSVTLANTYSVICATRSELYGSVIWSNNESTDQLRSVTVSPLVIRVTGWIGKPPVPTFEKQPASVMYDVVYKDATNSIVPNPNDRKDELLRATVEVPTNMTGNVTIAYADGISNYKDFRIFSEAAKALPKPELSKPELEFNFETQMFAIKNWKLYKPYVELIGDIEEKEDTPLAFSGMVDGEFVGYKKIQVVLRADQNAMWIVEEGAPDGQNDMLAPVELILKITPGTLSENWTYNEKTKLPVLQFDDEYFDGVVEYYYVDEDENTVKPSRMKLGTDYKAIAKVKDKYQKMFAFATSSKVESEGLPFTFGVTATEDPGNKEPEIPTPKDDTLGNLPLWQLAVSGISLLLFVVCSAKAAGEMGKCKAAKKEARELAQISYSFAPALLMVGTFLGMQENMWTVIAFVSLGLFFLSLITMIVSSKKRKAAELIVAREKARIAEEKEISKEEQHRAEQQRRDEEMRMMFASMQQSFQQQPQFDYNNLQNMIASSMNALLPAMQQTMAALPPAQDPSVYAQPALPAQSYGAQSEVDELRAQLAQQQSLINEFMHNQPSGQNFNRDASMSARSSEDLLTQFDASEGAPVPLEELYGKMSDEAKRYYYEIGCYIMERPNIMQNDGRYAVLFKYRGKTLFKLSIKHNAPVLTYISNGLPKDQRVMSAEELSCARQIMAACISQTDREVDN